MTVETLPLFRTKLHRPLAQADLVVRPRLLRRLDAHWQDRPLTLISAPAGYGKTVLASMWLQECRCPSGWISLDESDNDLRIFLAYLLAAVKQALPDLPLQSQALLEASTFPPVTTLARYLLNELDQNKVPFVLVLDDFHLIRASSVFEFLNELLKYLPPTVHLVLIGRQDPPIAIASMRAYRRITEVRMIDLCFTPSETAELLERTLHRNVDLELAAEWAEETEGWAAALHLAALSLRHHQSMAAPGPSVAADSRYLQAYLLAEVLAQVQPTHQAWLLRISLLDRFSAPLSEAVCQEHDRPADQTGQAFMQWLRQANLFLIDLDEEGEWFRFHHLFQRHLQDLLRSQSNPEQLASYHRRASEWLAKNGWTEEAIRHALAAGDSSTAVELVATQRYDLMNKDRWNRLENWLNLFPDEVVANDPILTITSAHVGVIRGHDTVALAGRDRTRRLLAARPSHSPVFKLVQGEIASISAMEGVLRGETAAVMANSREALASIPPQAVHLRCLATGTQAIAYQMAGDMKRSLEIIRQAVSNPDWSDDARAKLLVYNCIVCFMDGDLAGTYRAAAESLRLSKVHTLRTTICHVTYFLGIIHYLRNELAAAEPHLQYLSKNLALSPPSYATHGICALARLYHAQGRAEIANEILRLSSAYMEESGHSLQWEILGAFQVELALDKGDFALAQRLSETVNFDMRAPFWFYYVPQLTATRLMLAEGTAHSLKRALISLEELDDKVSRINRKTIRIDVLSLLALVYDALDDWQASSKRLTSALRLAKPGGFIRNFIDLGPPMADLLARLYEQGGPEMNDLLPYMAQILVAFQITEPGLKAATVENLPIKENRLTSREQQILRLLATELSPQEIASELTLSVHTVRTHSRNLYAKLEVGSRFEAIQRGKEIGLL